MCFQSPSSRIPGMHGTPTATRFSPPKKPAAHLRPTAYPITTIRRGVTWTPMAIGTTCRARVMSGRPMRLLRETGTPMVAVAGCGLRMPVTCGSPANRGALCPMLQEPGTFTMAWAGRGLRASACRGGAGRAGDSTSASRRFAIARHTALWADRGQAVRSAPEVDISPTRLWL